MVMRILSKAVGGCVSRLINFNVYYQLVNKLSSLRRVVLLDFAVLPT